MNSAAFRFPKRLRVFTGGCLFLLSLTACKESPPPAANPDFLNQKDKEQRLAWNEKTLVKAYQKCGVTNVAWDEPVIRALNEWARINAGLASLQQALPIITTNCSAARKAGCTDPLLAYEYARFVMENETDDAKTLADAYCDAAVKLKESSYPNVRKFYAQLRAVNQVYRAYGNNADWQLLVRVSGTILQDLRRTLSDKGMPPVEAYEAARQGLAVWQGNAKDYERCYHKIEEKLTQNWPDAAFVRLLKGEAYVEMAWHARGKGYASTVTEEGWKLFHERLNIAERALLEAWERDPKMKEIPLHMLTVALGKDYPREQMEVWFQRAMNLDTNFYQACYKKLLYLEPKWRGSEKAMLEFARECVTSKTWGGHVPLVLVDAHADLQSYLKGERRRHYWKRPRVWPDLKAAFEKFFDLNPNETTYRHNYALYAFKCEQWDDLGQQFKLLGRTNEAFFGGKAEFDRMLRLVDYYTSASKPNRGK